MHFKNKIHNFHETNEFQRFTFKRPRAIVHSFSLSLFLIKFYSLSFSYQCFRCFSLPGSLWDKELVKWATITQQRLTVKTQ